MVATWAIIRGVAQIVGAFQVKNEQTSQVLLGLGGLAWVVFGIMAMTRPAIGFLALMATIGVLAIIAGCLQIGLSFRVRSFGEKLRVAMLDETTLARMREKTAERETHR
ncbi:acid-resistance membrane protein [compost metagenome]